MDSEGNTPVEIELKYTSADLAPLELLLSHEELAGFRFRKLPTQSVVDRYFDTRDEDLRQNGLALRVRQLGNKVLATVKALGKPEGGIHRREEIEVAIPEGRDPMTLIESPIGSRIGILIGDKTLEEICEITQNRQRRLLSRNRKDTMELSVDEVTVSVGGTPRTFYELESELRSEGSEEDLEHLKESLEGMNLVPVAESKLERALKLMGKHTNEKSSSDNKGQKLLRLDLDEAVDRGFFRILRFHYRRFLKAEKGARKGKVTEDLHRMRVSSRRIRSAIFLFRPYLRDSQTKEIDRLMRRATQELGLVRDFDVLLLKLNQYSQELKAEAQNDLRVLEDFWSQRRDRNRKDLVAYFEGSKFRKLREEYRMFFKAFPKESPLEPIAEEIPQKKMRHVIPTMVWKAYEEVRRFEAALKDAPNETFHLLRIEAKRLRYTLEMFSDVLGNESAELLRRVIQLQEHLGTLQDSEVTANLLKEFLDDPGKKWKGEVTPSVQKTLKGYRRYLEKIQRHQKWSFDEVWEPVACEDFRKKLSDLLAAL